MDKQTAIIKISLRMFNKLPNELNQEEKDKVINTYYDFY